VRPEETADFLQMNPTKQSLKWIKCPKTIQQLHSNVIKLITETSTTVSTLSK